MSEPTYVHESTLVRGEGGVRSAQIPAEASLVQFGVHGAVAKHYGMDPSKLKEPHATTIDYVIAAAAA